MNHFLAIQHTYETVEIGFFKAEKLIARITENKKLASKKTVALVNSLLRDNSFSFDQLSFFATNQGPGPFTTLRVVIATINGLAFAAQKPLIGVDGLDALLDEYKDKKSYVAIALLNAYGGDVYFGIDQGKKINRIKGYENIESLLARLKEQFSTKTVRFIGQAVPIHLEQIKKYFDPQTVIVPDPLPKHCSIEQVGTIAWKKWNEQEGLVKQIFPHYLKSMAIGK